MEQLRIDDPDTTFPSIVKCAFPAPTCKNLCLDNHIIAAFKIFSSNLVPHDDSYGKIHTNSLGYNLCLCRRPSNLSFGYSNAILCNINQVLGL